MKFWHSLLLYFSTNNNSKKNLLSDVKSKNKFLNLVGVDGFEPPIVHRKSVDYE